MAMNIGVRIVFYRMTGFTGFTRKTFAPFVPFRGGLYNIRLEAAMAEQCLLRMISKRRD